MSDETNPRDRPFSTSYMGQGDLDVSLRMVACTGVAARWCPVHGDCSCRRKYDFVDPKCPLHSPDSTHADPLRDRDH